MYLGIVKIINEDGKLNLVRQEENSRALEYGIKMLEIPQEYRMDNAIRLKMVNEKAVNNLAHVIARFHSMTPTSKKVISFGTHIIIKKKINENLRTLSKLDKKQPFDEFYKRLSSFVSDNTDLFDHRMSEKKIRSIHGDLYLKNIFMITPKKFYLYDRIEFNNLLRYADVAEDVAHLAMDFDFVGQRQLRNIFVSKYLEKTNDDSLENLLYFLMCYKACVRAKVSLFRANTEKSDKVKNICRLETNQFLKLARSYLTQF